MQNFTPFIYTKHDATNIVSSLVLPNIGPSETLLNFPLILFETAKPIEDI